MTAPAPRLALIVDADRARTGVITDLLRSVGRFDVTTEKDIAPSLKRLRAMAPELIFVAGRMPAVDGFEFTRTYRRDAEMLSNEASVVMTFSPADLNDMQSAMNAGADAVLSFPVSQTRFSALVSALRANKRPFVRSATYVGPCRRRGMVASSGGGRRLADIGGAEALTVAVEALERLYEQTKAGPAATESLTAAAEALATYFVSLGEGDPADLPRLEGHCLVIARQFAEEAPGYPSFDRAFARLRKVMTAVLSKKQPVTATA